MSRKIGLATVLFVFVAGLAVLTGARPAGPAAGLQSVPACQCVAIAPLVEKEGNTVQFQASIAAFEQKTIDPAGGTYIFANGIKMTVPAGAVAQATTVGVRLIQEAEVKDIIQTGLIVKKFLAGVELVPYKFKFLKPIALAIPTAGLSSSTSLPYPLAVDTTKQIYALGAPKEPESNGSKEAQAASKKYTMRYNQKTRELEMPDLTEFPPEDWKTVAADLDKALAASDCVNQPCRCGVIVVWESSRDYIEDDKCVKVAVEGAVYFAECSPPYEEKFTLREFTVGAVKIEPDSTPLYVNEYLYLTATVLDAYGQSIPEYPLKWDVDQPDKVVIVYRGPQTLIIRAVAPTGDNDAKITATPGCGQKAGEAFIHVLCPDK